MAAGAFTAMHPASDSNSSSHQGVQVRQGIVRKGFFGGTGSRPLVHGACRDIVVRQCFASADGFGPPEAGSTEPFLIAE